MADTVEIERKYIRKQIRAQIRQLKADAEKHRAIADELDAQAELIKLQEDC